MNRRRLKTFRSIQGRILNRKTGFDKLRGEEYITIIYFKNFTFTVFYLFISKKSCLIESKNIRRGVGGVIKMLDLIQSIG